MMPSAMVLDLVKLLLTDARSQPRDALTFDLPDSALTPGDIPSLSHPPLLTPVGVAPEDEPLIAQEDRAFYQPAVRKGCVIGLKKPSSLRNGTIALDLTDLKVHSYGGPDGVFTITSDPIGHIYTARGGIADVAHARDHADLTRYLTHQILKTFKTGGEIPLGDDTDPFRPSTGDRVVTILPQGREPSLAQAALLGAHISYLVAVWHEIATFRNWQDYSCFSPEDNYSNLLGTYLGYCACITKGREYDAVMTANIFDVLLRDLRAIRVEPTTAAIQFLEGRWYCYDDPGTPFPDTNPLGVLKTMLRLKRRHCDMGLPGNGTPPTGNLQVVPWLVNGMWGDLPAIVRGAVGMHQDERPLPIQIPTADEHGTPLGTYFKFTIRNVAGKDMSVFDGLTTGNDLTSDQFGEVSARIRLRYLADDPQADQPIVSP